VVALFGEEARKETREAQKKGVIRGNQTRSQFGTGLSRTGDKKEGPRYEEIVARKAQKKGGARGGKSPVKTTGDSDRNRGPFPVKTAGDGDRNRGPEYAERIARKAQDVGMTVVSARRESMAMERNWRNPPVGARKQ
jgi:hypothetical protein